jgi:predicted esterase
MKMNDIETKSTHEVTTLLVSTPVHGRCLVRNRSLESLLIGFHGYAENAERHLAELDRIPGIETWSVAAVQALHPFYNSRTNEVVANWMTRQNRDEAIADNIGYVERVLFTVAAPGIRRIVFVGFSQGAAMAYRAAAALAARHPVAGLIILGGDLPPELAPRASSFPPVLLGRGSADDWFSEEKLEQDLKYLGASAQVVRYEGGHVWTDEFRAAAGQFLAALARAL